MKILPNNNIKGFNIGCKFTAGPSKIICTLTNISRNKDKIKYTHYHEILQEIYTTEMPINDFTRLIKQGWYQRL